MNINNFNCNYKDLTPTNLYKDNESRFDLFSNSNNAPLNNNNSNVNNSNVDKTGYRKISNHNSQYSNSVNTPMSITPKNNAANSVFSNNKEKLDSKTIIIENIFSGKDKRTTLMLRNIPLKYNINNLVEELNSMFIGKFDFVNMPINYDVSLNNIIINMIYYNTINN